MASKKTATKKGLLKGPKLNSRHSTVNAKATKVIEQLKRLDEVKKITLGPIKQLRPGAEFVKLTQDGYAVKAQCRDVNSVQILWIQASLEFCQEVLDEKVASL